MKLQITFLLLLFATILFSCENNNGDLKQTTIMVASKKVDCEGLIMQKCLLIREVDKQNWNFIYDGIKGFDYKEGFEYEILILEEHIENPPQDGSSILYTLIKVISKVEKTSENLPN